MMSLFLNELYAFQIDNHRWLVQQIIISCAYWGGGGVARSLIFC